MQNQRPPPAAKGQPHLLDTSMFWVATGGVHRVLATKHQRLPALGWRHTVLAPGASGPGCIDCGGLPLPGTGGYRLVLDRRHVQQLIEAARPDIVESADPYVPAWAVLAASARLRVPAVAFCHSNLPAAAARLVGGEQAMASGRGRWAARQARTYLQRLYAHFDLVMAPSASLTARLRHWGINQVVHQPLGVDCSVFRPAAADAFWRHRLCQRLGLDAHTRLLVYSGRFAPEKNLQLLADAVDSLGAGHVLLAVGAGPQPPRGRRVVLLRPEPDSRHLARLLASCDAYVHAGDIETFGLGVLEAMACGTPVVVSASGGVAELAQSSGLLVEGRRVPDWAEALHSTLQDGKHGTPSPRRGLGLAQARMHDWPRVLAQMSRRYRSLAGLEGIDVTVPAPLDTQPAPFMASAPVPYPSSSAFPSAYPSAAPSASLPLSAGGRSTGRASQTLSL